MRTHTLRDASEVGDGRWHRLHPLTPVLQGGVALLAILTAALAVLWESIILPTFLQFFGVADEGPDSRLWELVGQSLGWIAFGAVLVVVALVLEFWLQWRVHVVKMDADMIEVKRGLLVKSSRRARLDRINTIGVRRPLIPRLLGLAKLDIQAAGNDASVVLAYLPIRVAQDLRRMILAGDGGVHQEHNEEEIQREVEVPLFRYLAALVVSVETVVLFVVITGVTIFAVWAGEMAVWLALVLALFVYVVYLGERMIRSGNFVIDSLEGDIRVSLGLLSTSVETIPPERIHSLELSQPWAWKFFGWWRLNANLASQPGATDTKAPAHTVILPVATTAEVIKVVALGMPDLFETGTHTLVESMLKDTRSVWAKPGSLVCPPRAQWRIPFSAHLTGAILQSQSVLLRRGRAVARVSITPLMRVQSVSVSEGPWHRALGLTRLELQSVSGPIKLRVSGMDATEAVSWWEGVNLAITQALHQASPSPHEKVSS